MKILSSSDWHLDWTTYGIRRFDELSKAVDQSREHAAREEVDLYVFNGDLCDPDLSAPGTIMAIGKAIETAEWLRQRGIPSVWLRGNHDVIEDGSDRSTLTPLAGLGEDVHVFDTSALKPIPLKRKHPWGSSFCEVLALPYPSATKPYAMDAVFDAYDTAARLPNLLGAEPLLVLSHLRVPGVQPGEESGEMARGRDIDYPLERVLRIAKNNGRAIVLLQGHYHRQQSLNFGGVYMHIPGSLARLTFGEEYHTPGFMLIEVE